MEKSFVLIIIFIHFILIIFTCIQPASKDDNTMRPEPLSEVKFRDMVLITGRTYIQTDGTNSFTHTVSSFTIGKFEVTYQLWHTVYQWAMKNGYNFANAGKEGNDGTTGASPTTAKNEPVTTINWHDAIVWCNAYSQMTGYTPCYLNSGDVIKDSRDSNASICDNAVCEWGNNGYRLPSEGEWQFAASNKGVTPNTYASGAMANYGNSEETQKVAWYSANSENQTHNVGTTVNSSALTLYDMSGNVWEWCWDYYGAYPGSAQADYRGADSGAYRINRGGGFIDSADILQIGSRFNSISSYDEGHFLGFRVVRDMSSPDPFAEVNCRDMVPVIGGTYTQTDGTNSFSHVISNFIIGKYEVTYKLWQTVYQWAIKNGYYFSNAGIEGHDGIAGAAPTTAKNEPVTTINWRDAIVWCNAYSQMAGHTPCYLYSGDVIKDSRDSNASICDNAVCAWGNNGYRLPSEGEWQFAASNKGATPYNYASGAVADYNDAIETQKVAWYSDNSGSATHNTGTTANTSALTLYDMSGNVWEWCWDYHGAYPGSAQADYRGADSGIYRIYRGGSWYNSASGLQVGHRSFNYTYAEYSSIGFRVVGSL